MQVTNTTLHELHSLWVEAEASCAHTKMLWDLCLCMHECTRCRICFPREHKAAHHRDVKCKDKAAGEDGKGVNSSCWNVTIMFCVRTCARRRKCAWRILARATHGHESRKQTKKNNPRTKKMLSKQIPNPLRNIDPGAMLQAARDGRQPSCPSMLGERPAAATERECCRLNWVLNAGL